MCMEEAGQSYGGCYNDLYGDVSNRNNSVTGYTNVTIGAGAKMSLNRETYDNALCTISRGGNFKNEWGAFLFNEQVYAANKSKISETINSSKPLYHYLIKTNGNNANGSYGEVYTIGNGICIKPADGYTATVTDGDGSVLATITNEGGTYMFPGLNSATDTVIIMVTFQ